MKPKYRFVAGYVSTTSSRLRLNPFRLVVISRLIEKAFACIFNNGIICLLLKLKNDEFVEYLMQRLDIVLNFLLVGA